MGRGNKSSETPTEAPFKAPSNSEALSEAPYEAPSEAPTKAPSVDLDSERTSVPKKGTGQKWTEPQNKILHKYFKINIMEVIPVRQELTDAFLNSSEAALLFTNCHWRDIKTKI